jgi:hypothetical protein
LLHKAPSSFYVEEMNKPNAVDVPPENAHSPEQKILLSNMRKKDSLTIIRLISSLCPSPIFRIKAENVFI